MIRNVLVTEATPVQEKLPPISQMSITEIQNLAVANNLVNHKDYISPSTVQNLLNENDYDINVTGDDLETDIEIEPELEPEPESEVDEQF